MKFHVSQSRDCLFGQRNAVKFYQSFSFRLSTAYLTEAAFSFLFTSFSTRKQWKFLLATIKYSIRYNLLKYQIFLKANTFLLIYLIFNVKYPTPSRRLIGKLIFFFFYIYQSQKWIERKSRESFRLSAFEKSFPLVATDIVFRFHC